MNFPKFIFYSGHAEVLGPLFLAFETEIVTNRAPGSAIFLEYFTEVDALLNFKLFVKVFYKPTASLDDSDTQVFMIPSILTQRSDGTIAVDDFQQFLQSKIGTWNTVLNFENNIVQHCACHWVDDEWECELHDDDLVINPGVDDFMSELYLVCGVPFPSPPSFLKL